MHKFKKGKRGIKIKKETYEEFIEKFKPKKTTDDCYTPPKVYEAIKNWACDYYRIDPDKIVRPFYPGGDYENFDCSNGAIVVDNPPFSILTKIIDFYIERKIPFFLFAPALTLFSTMGRREKVNAVVTDSNIVYENGAKVKTAFVTSFGEYAIEVNLKLADAIDKEMREVQKKSVKQLPKYEYPKEVLMMNDLQKMANKGIGMSIKRKDLHFIRSLDDQREHKKALFGGGFLLSQQATKEKVEKAEKAKKTKKVVEQNIWKLSDREIEIIRNLG